VDNRKEYINHLSLCSGYEGIGLGLRRVLPNLREIAYVEREGFVAANLVAKMEEGKLDAAPVFTDVKTFPYAEFRGCVDIVSGGFPCQPFSNAGKRQATEDPRHLFPYIRDGIRDCQPRIVFLENVEGIISTKTADGESVLQYVLRELEGLGYRATAGVFSASEVGAPHQRKRVFILAYDNSQRVTQHSLSESVQEEYSTAGDCGDYGGILADFDSSRGGQDRMSAQLWSEGAIESSCNRWPARPSQPQHEWEEPRVTGQTESKLGRATNGSSSRVDRLRLLGNGVVPATAAKAFVTLIQRVL
jgi:DNA (cytosine-5)-methyltransferase 1